MGLIYCCVSSSNILRTKITDWLVRIQIKIKPPYNLKCLGDKVVFLFYPVLTGSKTPTSKFSLSKEVR
ncbi:hypothetical protein FC699_16940 [Bacillus wiedmannii]|uniref:Uncharacterized protein n=1 Tax=Bacillus wiedmannii TaxID=1890302 RepID=A0A4U2MWH9_9BACI|nr:hypothetical protein FC694_14165 [Bacillus wiedmannii]TKI93844.1 hypothetical protein FC699_16940 [Bacillus wiedmannii]